MHCFYFILICISLITNCIEPLEESPTPPKSSSRRAVKDNSSNPSSPNPSRTGGGEEDDRDKDEGAGGRLAAAATGKTARRLSSAKETKTAAPTGVGAGPRSPRVLASTDEVESKASVDDEAVETSSRSIPKDRTPRVSDTNAKVLLAKAEELLTDNPKTCPNNSDKARVEADLLVAQLRYNQKASITYRLDDTTDKALEITAYVGEVALFKATRQLEDADTEWKINSPLLNPPRLDQCQSDMDNFLNISVRASLLLQSLQKDRFNSGGLLCTKTLDLEIRLFKQFEDLYALAADKILAQQAELALAAAAAAAEEESSDEEEGSDEEKGSGGDDEGEGSGTPEPEPEPEPVDHAAAPAPAPRPWYKRLFSCGSRQPVTPAQ